MMHTSVSLVSPHPTLVSVSTHESLSNLSCGARATEKITGLRESGARGREADAGCVSRSSGPDSRLGSHQASVTWTLGDKEERTYITPSENTVDLHSCEVEM